VADKPFKLDEVKEVHIITGEVGPVDSHRGGKRDCVTDG
jgi:hypothetical protein